MSTPDLPIEVEAANRELDRIEAKTRNARLDWALQSDEPCDLIDDLALACRIARDAYAAGLAAGAQGEREARYTVLPPYLARQGFPPIRTAKPCLYTQIDSCIELHPNSPDHWCGYCARTHEAQAAPSDAPAGRE